jgi:hypothetical protein
MALRRMIAQPNFDSTLAPAQPGRPAKLTINLKVTLVPLDPSVPWTPTGTQLPPTHLAASKAHMKHGQVKDYNNTAVACRSWLVQEWSEYKVRFKRAVEHAWNNQMILLPTESGEAGDGLSDQDYRQFISDPKIQAHAEGAIDITLMPLNVVGHALIEVAHLENAGARFRVWMHRITDESVQFARHEDKKWPGWFTGQITAAHEVGHWLRSLNSTHFEHIDAEYAKNLPAARRAKEQYGHTLGRKAALMGDGSLVTDHEARPWLTRIRRQTTMKLGWSMMHKIHFRNVVNNLSDRQKRLTSRP